MPISKVIGILSIVIITCCILLSILIGLLYNTSLNSNKAFEEERILNTLATELSDSSNALTRYVRLFVVTGESHAEQNYIDIINERNGKIIRKKTRSIAPGEHISLIELMRRHGVVDEELAKVTLANKLSDKLVSLEEEAIHAAKGYFKDSFGNYTIKKEPNKDYAIELVFSDIYYAELDKIQQPLNEFFVMLRTRNHNETVAARELVYFNILLLAGTISIVLILALLFVWYVRYRICLPLGQMAASVKRGSKSSLKEESFFSNKNEIIILEQAFSARVDIETKLRENQLDLEDNIRTANLASESKSLFLARMSHEIRTPMNSIIGMSNITKRKLEENNFNKNEIKSHLRQIEVSSQHLLELLNDILDISKIEAGKIDLSFEPFDLPSLINSAADIIKPRCEEKNIKFITNIIGLKHTSFISDPLRLRQVLINLLGNAIKFTDECGEINFIITPQSSKNKRTQINFLVKDTGIGIAEKDLKKLFKPFAQGNTQISKKYGGSGLGLSISQSIVTMMGGNIKVSSSVGSGSTFSFNVWFEECNLESEDIKAQKNLDSLRGKRILLVDDVDINRMIVIELLFSTGLKFEEAKDGSIGVKMFEDSEPGYYDLILMDIQMPEMDGYEATSYIRSLDHADSKSIPIVAITANAFKDDIEKSVKSGMNNHLPKPVEYEKLLKVLLNFLCK